MRLHSLWDTHVLLGEEEQLRFSVLLKDTSRDRRDWDLIPKAALHHCTMTGHIIALLVQKHCISLKKKAPRLKLSKCISLQIARM